MSSPIPDERASKLSRLLRSRSTSNMFDTISSSLATPRTNSPSSSHVSSRNHNGISTNDSGRWSMKSLKRGWMAKTHTRSSSHFPDGRSSDRAATEHHNPVTYSPSPSSPPSRNEPISRFRSKSSSGVLLGGRVPGHQEWPERTSSRKGWGHPLRTSVSSKTLSRIICSEEATPETQSPIRRNISRSVASTRVAAEPGKGFYDYQPTVQVKQPAPESGLDDRNGRKVPTQSRPGNPHQRPTLSRGASKNSLTISIENHGQPAGQLNLGYSGTSTSSHAGDRGILSRQTLAPPKEPPLPDSPGFPKMLAAMTFPSPPTTSRPPSSERSLGPKTHCQASTTDPPAVRPRTSSKRAYTSSGLPAASLDELLMQPSRSAVKPAELGEDASHLTSMSEEYSAPIVDGASAATLVGAGDASLTLDDRKSRPSSGASSTPARTTCDSTTPATSDNANSQRQSLMSDITITSSPQGSPTIACAAAAANDDVNERRPFPGGVTHRFCSSLPIISPTLAQSCRKQDPISTDLALRGCNQSLIGKTVTNIRIPDFVDGRKSIVERRMARRAKVQAYKRRDLDAAKLALRAAALESRTLESKDSPILGWFTDNVSRPRHLPLRERSHARISHVVHIAHRSHDDISQHGEESASSGSSRIIFSNCSEIPKTSSAVSVTRDDWALSPIMTIEIIPEYASVLELRQATKKIAISPIMVVADLKSQPGSSVLSISSIHSPAAYPSSRPVLKHRLKIMPQTRPRPVSIMMHRNPTTGDIERTISSSNKVNRHSFTSMPSLPPSPDSPAIRRRSHPPGIFSSTQSSTIWDPIVASEEPIADTTDLDKYKGNKERVVSMKERLQREKLAREEEISKLVEKTINAIKPEQSVEGEREKSHGEHIEQQIEGRIQRLEENGDAWLRVVKGLLENMSKTLHDIREENNIGGLTMGEFTVNLDAEAKRISYNPSTLVVDSITTECYK